MQCDDPEKVPCFWPIEELTGAVSLSSGYGLDFQVQFDDPEKFPCLRPIEELPCAVNQREVPVPAVTSGCNAMILRKFHDSGL